MIDERTSPARPEMPAILLRVLLTAVARSTVASAASRLPAAPPWDGRTSAAISDRAA